MVFRRRFPVRPHLGRFARGERAGRPAVTSSVRVFTTTYSLVRVARPLSDETAPLHRFAMLTIALACCGALVAMLVMALLTGRILRPTRRLTAAVEHVTAAGDLTADLGVGGRQGGRDDTSCVPR